MKFDQSSIFRSKFGEYDDNSYFSFVISLLFLSACAVTYYYFVQNKTTKFIYLLYYAYMK